MLVSNVRGDTVDDLDFNSVTSIKVVGSREDWKPVGFLQNKPGI